MPDTQEIFDYEQLSLEMVIEEEEKQGDGSFIAPDEAKRISEAARVEFENNGSASRWIEDYEFLRSRGFAWRVAAYIAWASSPKESRWPKTQMLLATEVLGLTSDRVITTWRRKNPMIVEMINRFQTNQLWEYRADMIEALRISASNPDYKHANDRKTALTMTKDYVPHIKVDTKNKMVPGGLKDLSNEELQRLIRPLKKDAKNGTGESSD